ncbi:MAG: hypothetical protein AAFZ65_00350 [Planctomycetota bacterium]
MARLLRLGSRLSLTGAGIALAVLGAEALTRLAAPQPPSWLAVYEHHDQLPYALQPDLSYRVETGETRWTIVTDGHGRRVDPTASADAERPKWLVAGDSFAFGHGCEAADGLVTRLAVEAGADAINLAVPGYGPEQFAASLAAHIDLEPVDAVVVVPFLGNDFHDLTWNKEVPITDGLLNARRNLKSSLCRTSHLYRLASQTLHRFGIGGGGPNRALERDLIEPQRFEALLAPARDKWHSAFRSIRRLCAERQLPLVVLLLPNRAATEPDRTGQGLPPTPVDVDLARKTAKAWLADSGIRALDATETLRALDGPLYFDFDGHYRPSVNRALARAMAPSLVNELETARAAIASSH